jgi:hypothetical protein
VWAERYFPKLDEWIARPDNKAMWVTGEAAIGKTALIANWLARRRKVAPDDIVFEHYVGASPNAADPIFLYRNLWSQLNAATSAAIKLPGSDADILARHALTGRLAKAAEVAESRGCRIIIALDDVDRLHRIDIPPEHYDAFDHHDHWTWARRLDSLKPGRVKLLASYTDYDAVPLAVRLDCEAKVCALGDEEQRLLVEGTLERWGRKLSQARMARILSHPLAAQPLFLKTTLNELRFSATEPMLDARLDYYASAANWADLFARVLERIETDFGVEMVRTVTGLVWVSRAGMTETDIMDCADITPLAWAKLRNNFDEALRIAGGLVQFSNDLLRRAVGRRYLPTIETQHALRLKLADYLERLPPSPWKREELPFQLRATRQWDRLDRSELPPGIGDEKMAYIYALEERGKPRSTHGPFHIYQQMAGGGDMLAVCQHCYHVKHFVPREGEHPGDSCPNCGADRLPTTA